MELLNSIIDVPYMFHCLTVSGVLLGAILLFVFGFKSTEEPSFNKLKGDLKLNATKKKAKDKKSVSSSPKTNVVAAAKTKTSKSEDKARKTGALKDSKNVNIDAKKSEDEFFVKESKQKGKENRNVDDDSGNEEGGWKQAMSRKDRKNKKSRGLDEAPKRSAKESNHSSSTISKKELDSTNNKSSQKEKKQKYKESDDLGVWQEAKSSKKRRKVQKEA